MDVIEYPHESLSKACDEVTVFDEELSSLVVQMYDAMVRGDGVGLAAPQVGVNKRVIVMDPSAGVHTDALCVMVNPTITFSSPDVVVGTEGCLSLPGVRCEVRRHKMVTVSYSDVTGENKKLDLVGQSARICQHEIDHLDGVMFIDRIGAKHRKLALKMMKYHRRTK